MGEELLDVIRKVDAQWQARLGEKAVNTDEVEIGK